MSTSAQIISIVVGPCLAVYVVFQLRQIHHLVNSRLTEALREIRRLGGDSADF
jgi:hypothetical protein